MALMAGGSTPARGPYGQQVDRALDYVLANAQASGFICEPAATSHGPMYGHGFATTFLAECYGMSPRPDLREKLSKAVKLIVNCAEQGRRLALLSPTRRRRHLGHGVPGDGAAGGP